MASVGNIFIATISRLNNEYTNSQDLVAELAQQLTDSTANNDKLVALESTTHLLALSLNNQEIAFYSNCIEQLITLTQFNNIGVDNENDFIIRLQNISISLIEAGANVSNLLKLLLDKITLPYQENILNRRLNSPIPGQSTSLIDIAIVQKNRASLEVLLSFVPTRERSNLFHSWITTENIFPLEVALKLNWCTQVIKNNYLIIASEANRLKVMELLFEHKAEVNAFNKGESPLLAAAAAGHDKAIALLIKQGATVNHPSYIATGRLPIIYAALYGHDICVQLLLEAGAVFCQTAALHHNNVLGSSVDDYLMWGVKPNAIGGNLQKNALTYAVQGKNIKCVQLLLEYYTSANKARHCSEALRAAACSKELLALLLAHGADINWVNGGQTVLMTAVYRANVDSVKFLLENGANIDLANNQRLTALGIALNLAINNDSESLAQCIALLRQHLAPQDPLIMSASNDAPTAAGRLSPRP